MTEAKPHRPSRGARSLSREFALLGVYEWLVSGADAVTIERTLLSVLSDDGEPIAGAAIDAADFEPDQKIRAVTDIYNKVGIAEMCNQRISAYYEEGLRLLDEVEVDSALKVNLRDFVCGMMKRKL